jgi:hypothetical protein
MTLVALPEGVLRADGMTGVIVFAVVYAIVSILAKAKQATQKQQQEHQQQQQQARQQKRVNQQRQERQPRPAPRPATRPAGDTQAEAVKLQDLLRALGEAAGVPTPDGPIGRRSTSPLPSAEEVEERESLEVEEEVRNLETEERRPVRKEVDFDDEAEQIVQRRIRAAQERDRPLSKADHAAFDSGIRAVADATRVARPKLDSLRRAIVWREILGPPVSLRKPDSEA